MASDAPSHSLSADNGPVIQSLDEAQVAVALDVRDYLTESLMGLHQNVESKAREHMDRILQAMKRAPSMTTCRVNQIRATREEIEQELRNEVVAWQNRHKREDQPEDAVVPVRPHPVLSDVVSVGVSNPDSSNSLASCRVPPVSADCTSLFKSWPKRAEIGWPMTHKVVICDQYCGEAVLRGSDIFVRGVICTDLGIQAGEQVAVYADIRQVGGRPVSRGLMIKNYMGRCIFLGMGIARCSRTEMVTSSGGVAVEMSSNPAERAGPALPPLSGLLVGKCMMQNVPSAVVAHALDPQPAEVIIDLCSAPGGKTSHVASIVRNKAIVVACDKSHKKMMAAREFFDGMGATCITRLAWDSTACVVRDGSKYRSVHEVLSAAPVSERDGMPNVKEFYPESFDRVLLDPPCSALGLRPKLQVAATLNDLQKHVKYQRQFVREAVSLLKPGGTMTYSTCTIHAAENEGMVRHVLDEYPEMKLVNVGIDIGLPGLPDVGLEESERGLVRRFDPSDVADTMGFFIAKFVKLGTSQVEKRNDVEMTS